MAKSPKTPKAGNSPKPPKSLKSARSPINLRSTKKAAPPASSDIPVKSPKGGKSPKGVGKKQEVATPLGKTRKSVGKTPKIQKEIPLTPVISTPEQQQFTTPKSNAPKSGKKTPKIKKELPITPVVVQVPVVNPEPSSTPSRKVKLEKKNKTPQIKKEKSTTPVTTPVGATTPKVKGSGAGTPVLGSGKKLNNNKSPKEGKSPKAGKKGKGKKNKLKLKGEKVAAAAPAPSEFKLDMEAIAMNGKNAAEALLDYSRKKKAGALFKDLPSRIVLKIGCFKIPTLSDPFTRILLPNSPHPDSADIILVIKGDKKTDNEDYVEDELKASLYKQKLQMEHGIKIREVFTLRTLNKEYKPYEAKRALLSRIDGVLCDKSVIKHMPEILGRDMYRKNKFAIPVNFAKKDSSEDEEIKAALRRTVLTVSTTGTESNVVIGNDEMTAIELQENFLKVCQNLRKNFPGGWKNIARIALSIPGEKIPHLTIHVAETDDASISKPIVRKRKLRETVEDEITTQPNKKIRILPDGTIRVLNEAGEAWDDVEIPDDEEIVNRDEPGREQSDDEEQKDADDDE